MGVFRFLFFFFFFLGSHLLLEGVECLINMDLLVLLTVLFIEESWGVSEWRNISDNYATNNLFFVVAISSILLTHDLPHPSDSWSRVLTFELWHDDLWYAHVLFILATFEFFIFSPKLHLLQMLTEFLKSITCCGIWFFYNYLCWYVHIYVHMYMC